MAESLPLEEQIIAALRRITRAIDLHSRLLLNKHGLTAPQLLALQAIARLQPVTASGLAREIHLSQATVTGILGRLERRELIARSRDERDRRSVVVRITPQGTSLLEAAPSPLQSSFRRQLHGLEQWEQTMILAMLQRIATMMDAEHIDAAPVLKTGVVE